MSQSIESDLIEHLQKCLPQHNFKDVIEYAVLPPGKLFRPKLVVGLANDLKSFTSNHKYLASSIEIHHAYTLVHDDLPAMDDDDFRRGKPSTHKKFNEAQAILVGDALLNFSYELLSNIEATYLPKVLKLYGETTGSRGLILGQVMDLDENEKSLEDIITTHSLKTSCLMQLALEGTNILSDSKLPKEKVMQLGFALGIVFQLLDDLSELGDEISSHEQSINPFLKFNQSTVLNKLTEHISIINEITTSFHLINLKEVLDDYLLKMKGKIEENQTAISKHVSEVKIIFSFL